MTCIVGIERPDGVMIGGDSAASNYSIMYTREDRKVFHNEGLIIGYTDSFRMGQLLRYRLEIPPHHPPDKDDFEYLATDFIDAVRAVFTDHGFLHKEHEEESGGEFLVAYRGRLYFVCGDFQVGRAAEPYIAIGSGGEVALGALYAMHHYFKDKLTSQHLAIFSLQAAADHTPYVRQPFWTEWQARPEG